MNKSFDILLQEMDILRDRYILLRAHFPAVDRNMVGAMNVPNPPFYHQFGHILTFHFSRGLTIADIDGINDAGHYINQNFFIRLYSLLQSYGIYGNDKLECRIKKRFRKLFSFFNKANLKQSGIDKTIDGSEDLDILRRLRNRFAHSSGKADLSKKNDKKLINKLTTHYRLPLPTPVDFPLSIDTVNLKMYEGCRRYVENLIGRSA